MSKLYQILHMGPGKPKAEKCHKDGRCGDADCCPKWQFVAHGAVYEEENARRTAAQFEAHGDKTKLIRV